MLSFRGFVTFCKDSKLFPSLHIPPHVVQVPSSSKGLTIVDKKRTDTPYPRRCRAVVGLRTSISAAAAPQYHIAY